MKRKSYKVLLMAMMVMSLSMVMPNTAEAASKKPAVKSVELRVGGKKVNSKTITVKQGSKTKVQVIVNPSKAKKSVKWAKLSKKSKKIAYIKGSTIKAGKKNGTVKMTVTVKGKNGKSKKAWFKVKVVKTLPKPSTPSTPSKPVSPASPSNPSKPGTPSNPTGKTYEVTWQGVGGRVHRVTYPEGTPVNADSIKDTTVKDWNKSTGWYTAPNGGTRVTNFNVTGTITLYGQCVAKDPMKDWNPSFVQGTATNLASNKVYDNDGIKTYDEVVNSYTFKEAWLQCDECGTTYQFMIKGLSGNTIVVDHFLRSSTGKAYVLTKDVKSSKSLSADWCFLDITAAYEACETACGKCSGFGIINGTFDPHTSASYSK